MDDKCFVIAADAAGRADVPVTISITAAHLFLAKGTFDTHRFDHKYLLATKLQKFDEF